MIGETGIPRNPANEQMHENLWLYLCRCNCQPAESTLSKTNIDPARWAPKPVANGVITLRDGLINGSLGLFHPTYRLKLRL